MRAILLVKTSSLGDVIHNLPVVSDLHRSWPNAKIDWVVEESFSELPRMHPTVRHVIPIAIRRWRKNLAHKATRTEIANSLRELRQEYYDLIIDTQGLVKSAVLTWLAQGLRCGYSRQVAREPLAALAYDCRYDIPRSAHAVERNRWLAAAAAGYAPDLPLRYGLRAPQQLPAWLGTEPYCVLLTATSRNDKLWPEAHWIDLGKRLQQCGMRAILPAGNEGERLRAERLAAQIPGALVAPPSNLTTLASVLQGAHGVVGVDTGLTHLAAALDRPVVALYVATDPGLTGVYAGRKAINLGGKSEIPSPETAALALVPMLCPPDITLEP